MNKAYNQRINWKNGSEGGTPLDASNLNKMDLALYTIDTNVVTLDTQQNALVSSISYNSSTAVLTITKKNSESDTINLGIAKATKGMRYDAATQELVLIQDDDTEIKVSLSAFITESEFGNTDTIQSNIDSDGVATFYVKNNSITEEKLETGYLSSIKEEVAKTATNAATCEANGTLSYTQARYSESYCKGGVKNEDGTDFRENQDTDNCKYYNDEVTRLHGEISNGTLIMIIPKGDWDSATQYHNLDMVNHSGKSWIARKDSLNVEPGTDDTAWQESLGGGTSESISNDDIDTLFASTE